MILKGNFEKGELKDNMGILEYDNGDIYEGGIEHMKR